MYSGYVDHTPPIIKKELTAKNASVLCGLSIKPYEIPKKGEGGKSLISYPLAIHKD
jgi:hypothetical protein